MMVAQRDSRPLSVDASELLRQPGASLDVRLSPTIEGLAVPLARVRRGTSLTLALTLDALVDAIHVTGSLTAELALSCRRCLQEMERTATFDVDELVAYPDDDRDDAYALAGETIDLEEIIRDVVVGDLPFNPVCTPGCKGLCPTCGVDRNATDCGHDAAPTDIRWSALADLKERMEG